MNFTYAVPSSLDTSQDSISVKLSQHIWAFVKVFVNLERIQTFDEKVYDLLRKTLVESPANNSFEPQTNTFTKLMYAAERLQQKYESSQANYATLIRQINPAFKLSNADFNSFISYINYNGSETYFTRGTFLDVVVNRQMCKADKIKLSQDEYLDSFIENMADLMINYHKDKYLTRSVDALKQVTSLHNSSVHQQITNILNMVKGIQKFCKGDKHELLDCSAFLFMYNCIVCIRLAAETVLAQYDSQNNLTDSIITNLENFLDGNLSNYDTLLNVSNNSIDTPYPQVDIQNKSSFSSNLRKFGTVPNISSFAAFS